MPIKVNFLEKTAEALLSKEKTSINQYINLNRRIVCGVSLTSFPYNVLPKLDDTQKDDIQKC